MLNVYGENSQVLLIDGSSKDISNIKIGDIVVSDVGETKVIAKNIFYIQDAFELKIRSNRSIICSDNCHFDARKTPSSQRSCR